MTLKCSRASLRLLTSILLASSTVNAAAVPNQLDTRAPQVVEDINPLADLPLNDVPKVDLGLKVVPEPDRDDNDDDDDNVFDDFADTLRSHNGYEFLRDLIERLFGMRGGGPRVTETVSVTATAYISETIDAFTSSPTTSEAVVTPPGPPLSTAPTSLPATSVTAQSVSETPSTSESEIIFSILPYGPTDTAVNETLPEEPTDFPLSSPIATAVSITDSFPANPPPGTSAGIPVASINSSLPVGEGTQVLTIPISFTLETPSSLGTGTGYTANEESTGLPSGTGGSGSSPLISATAAPLWANSTDYATSSTSPEASTTELALPTLVTVTGSPGSVFNVSISIPTPNTELNFSTPAVSVNSASPVDSANLTSIAPTGVPDISSILILSTGSGTGSALNTAPVSGTGSGSVSAVGTGSLTPLYPNITAPTLGTGTATSAISDLSTAVPSAASNDTTLDAVDFPGLLALRRLCQDPQIRVITLPLLNRFYGPKGYPSLFAFPGCLAPNSRQAIQAPGLLDCTALGAELQRCQASGRKVLLSIKADGFGAVGGDSSFGDPASISEPFLGSDANAIMPEAAQKEKRQVLPGLPGLPNILNPFRPRTTSSTRTSSTRLPSNVVVSIPPLVPSPIVVTVPALAPSAVVVTVPIPGISRPSSSSLTSQSSSSVSPSTLSTLSSVPISVVVPSPPLSSSVPGLSAASVAAPVSSDDVPQFDVSVSISAAGAASATASVSVILPSESPISTISAAVSESIGQSISAGESISIAAFSSEASPLVSSIPAPVVPEVSASAPSSPGVSVASAEVAEASISTPSVPEISASAPSLPDVSVEILSISAPVISEPTPDVSVSSILIVGVPEPSVVTPSAGDVEPSVSLSAEAVGTAEASASIVTPALPISTVEIILIPESATPEASISIPEVSAPALSTPEVSVPVLPTLSAPSASGSLVAISINATVSPVESTLPSASVPEASINATVAAPVLPSVGTTIPTPLSGLINSTTPTLSVPAIIIPTPLSAPFANVSTALAAASVSEIVLSINATISSIPAPSASVVPVISINATVEPLSVGTILPTPSSVSLNDTVPAGTLLSVGSGIPAPSNDVSVSINATAAVPVATISAPEISINATAPTLIILGTAVTSVSPPWANSTVALSTPLAASISASPEISINATVVVPSVFVETAVPSASISASANLTLPSASLSASNSLNLTVASATLTSINTTIPSASVPVVSVNYTYPSPYTPLPVSSTVSVSANVSVASISASISVSINATGIVLPTVTAYVPSASVQNPIVASANATASLGAGVGVGVSQKPKPSTNSTAPAGSGIVATPTLPSISLPDTTSTEVPVTVVPFPTTDVGDGPSFPNLFDESHPASAFALTLFSLFGEGHTERADLRPLGPDVPSPVSPEALNGTDWVNRLASVLSNLARPLGEEVVIDGFDIQLPAEWKGTYQDRAFKALVARLRELNKEAWDESGGVEGGPSDLGADGRGVVYFSYTGEPTKRSVEVVQKEGWAEWDGLNAQ